VRALDISRVVQDIGSLLEVSVRRGVDLRLRLADGLPPVDGDATQIQQLVMNLVINAAEAAAETGGTVMVTTVLQEVDEDYLRQALASDEIAPGRYVALEVHDTGCGMDEDTKGRVFDPFFTTKAAGRGLGLAAALGIVRSHRGAMKVYSVPGKGTSFKVLLPVSEGGAPERREHRPELTAAG
jgi:signal transduction histidine kinase